MTWGWLLGVGLSGCWRRRFWPVSARWERRRARSLLSTRRCRRSPPSTRRRRWNRSRAPDWRSPAAPWSACRTWPASSRRLHPKTSSVGCGSRWRVHGSRCPPVSPSPHAEATCAPTDPQRKSPSFSTEPCRRSEPPSCWLPPRFPERLKHAELPRACSSLQWCRAPARELRCSVDSDRRRVGSRELPGTPVLHVVRNLRLVGDLPRLLPETAMVPRLRATGERC